MAERSAYLRAELAHARGLGARRIETVVLASSTEGLGLAVAHGFVDLHLPAVQPGAGGREASSS